MEERSVLLASYRSTDSPSRFWPAELFIGTCCAALMSIASSQGKVSEATSIDKWRTILNAFIDEVQACLVEGHDAGGMRFANSMPRVSQHVSYDFLFMADVDCSGEARC